MLRVGDAALDHGRARLAFDRLIDPDQPADLPRRPDAMAEGVRRLAGPGAGPDARIAALRRFLYVAGPWNEGRPFGYDHADPLGQRIAGKLLGRYLATRRGNCVSMLALFVILGERLGLDVAFATAPLHVFVRYTTEAGQVMNIEAANGGAPCRDAWYRERMPMSDRAVANGVYLRTLPKREGIALLATVVLEWLHEQGRFAEALLVGGRNSGAGSAERVCAGEAGACVLDADRAGVHQPLRQPGASTARPTRATGAARKPARGGMGFGRGAGLGADGVIFADNRGERHVRR